MISLLKVMTTINFSGSKVGLGIQYWGFGIPMATFIFFNFMETIQGRLMKVPILMEQTHLRHLVLLFSRF